MPPVARTLALPSFAPLQEMLLIIWLVAERVVAWVIVADVTTEQALLSVIVTV